MADRTNEEILAEHEARVIACAEATRLYGQNGSAEFGASEMSRAAVLARMCGPGEVVVPKEPTDEMLALLMGMPPVGPLMPTSRRLALERYAAALAARSNNGGTDDAAA